MTNGQKIRVTIATDAAASLSNMALEAQTFIREAGEMLNGSLDPESCAELKDDAEAYGNAARQHIMEQARLLCGALQELAKDITAQ